MAGMRKLEAKRAVAKRKAPGHATRAVTSLKSLRLKVGGFLLSFLGVNKRFDDFV